MGTGSSGPQRGGLRGSRGDKELEVLSARPASGAGPGHPLPPSRPLGARGVCGSHPEYPSTQEPTGGKPECPARTAASLSHAAAVMCDHGEPPRPCTSRSSGGKTSHDWAKRPLDAGPDTHVASRPAAAPRMPVAQRGQWALGGHGCGGSGATPRPCPAWGRCGGQRGGGRTGRLRPGRAGPSGVMAALGGLSQPPTAWGPRRLPLLGPIVG